MTVHFQLVPLLSLIAGVALLLVPRMHRYILAAYLIAVGLIGLIR